MANEPAIDQEFLASLSPGTRESRRESILSMRASQATFPWLEDPDGAEEVVLQCYDLILDAIRGEVRERARRAQEQSYGDFV